MRTTRINGAILIALLAAGPTAATAKVGEAQAAQLGGPALTCLGAERSGSEQGVADYTGKYVDAWPGLRAAHGYDPGPYADEAPSFVISAANVAEYADRLTAGQLALFKAYPDTFRMRVFPSHRDFGVPDWVCDVARDNARHAQLIDQGLGTEGLGGAPAFPLPQSAEEVMRSVQTAYRAWTERITSSAGRSPGVSAS